MPVYLDDETGKAISTHSMMKTFRRCPKQMEYKYVRRLKPKMQGKPLRQGTWMHKLLEVHYKGGDWKVAHQQLSYMFSDLFDEERDAIGDLPTECKRMMESYLWHYANDPWEIIEVELTLETELPDGSIYRAKVDLMIQNQWGLWIIDHKFNATLPDLTMRILDAQSALYLWAALRCGYPVQGFMWNYVKRKPPGVPELLKDGSRLSRKKIDTDYPTLYRTIKKNGLELKDYREHLRYLKSLRFQHGEPQLSPFFRRDILEKNNAMLTRVAQEAVHTSKRMNEYPWDRTGYIERVPDRSCGFMCNYRDVCTMELFGGDPRNLIKQKYSEADPMYYYHDDPKELELRTGI